MDSARLLHPPGVAEVGRGQDRVVVATGDRAWGFANREAAASAWAMLCLLSLVRRGAQQAPVPHDSTPGAIVSARAVALSLPPNPSARIGVKRARRGYWFVAARGASDRLPLGGLNGSKQKPAPAGVSRSHDPPLWIRSAMPRASDFAPADEPYRRIGRWRSRCPRHRYRPSMPAAATRRRANHMAPRVRAATRDELLSNSPVVLAAFLCARTKLRP